MKTAFLMLLSILALIAAAIGLTRREETPQAVAMPYAKANIQRYLREKGNPPNLTGGPGTPGYGNPNVSDDIARQFGWTSATLPRRDGK